MARPDSERQPIYLPDGLRVWPEARPGTGTVSLALVMPIGTRHDPPRQRTIPMARQTARPG